MISAQSTGTYILKASGLGTTDAELRTNWEAIATQLGVQFTNTCSFSPFWRLVSALVTKPVLWLSEFLGSQIIPNMFLYHASGAWLDLLAWERDISRQPATKARGTITLYRDSVGAELTIPAGTLIQSPPINGNVYRVATLNEYSLKSGETAINVLVEAEKAGNEYNIAVGFYSLLSTDLVGKLRVQPSTDWLLIPGRDQETDHELRLRTRNRFSAINRWHIDAAYKDIISTFAGIPVENIVFEHDAPRGAGTANAYIVFDGEPPNVVYFDAINQHIKQELNHGLGDDVLVMPIPYYEIDVNATYKAPSYLTEPQASELKANLENYIFVAFRSLSTETGYTPTQTQPNKPFVWSKLIQELHNQFPLLTSFDFADDNDLESRLGVPRLRTLTLVRASA